MKIERLAVQELHCLTELFAYNNNGRIFVVE